MQIWKWKSTPASVLLCIVRSTYAAVSRPTISSSSVSSLRWQRNIALYEPVWSAGPIIFSVCCLCGTELCRGGGCLRDTFPLRWQWGQCNDNVGDSTPTTSTMGTLWNNSGISFKVFWFSRLPLATTPKLMVTFVYQTGCPFVVFPPWSKKSPWNHVHRCRTVQITAQHCKRHYRPGCGLL